MFQKFLDLTITFAAWLLATLLVLAVLLVAYEEAIKFMEHLPL